MELKRHVLTACVLLAWTCMMHAQDAATQHQNQRTEQANRDATVPERRVRRSRPLDANWARPISFVET